MNYYILKKDCVVYETIGEYISFGNQIALTAGSKVYTLEPLMSEWVSIYFQNEDKTYCNRVPNTHLNSKYKLL